MMTIYSCSTETDFSYRIETSIHDNTWLILVVYFAFSCLSSARLRRNLLDYFTSIQSAMHFMKACHFRSNHSRKVVLNILTLARPSRFASSAYFSCVHSFFRCELYFFVIWFFSVAHSLARWRYMFVEFHFGSIVCAHPFSRSCSNSEIQVFK